MTGQQSDDALSKCTVDPFLVPCESLRWQWDSVDLPFETTDDLEPETGVVGQDQAIEALRFGLETNAPGHNIFVRGLVGTGRMTLLRRLLEESQPFCPLASDRCYVHNFTQPEQPRLITLPRGVGRRFGRRIEELIDFIKNDLDEAVSTDAIQAGREALGERAKEELGAIGKPFEEELRRNELTMVTVPVGPAIQPVILPLMDGEPATPEHLARARAKGKISDEEIEGLKAKVEAFTQRFEEVTRKLQQTHRRHREAIREYDEKQLRRVLGGFVREIDTEFPHPGVPRFLNSLMEDVVQHHGRDTRAGIDFTALYPVNVLLSYEGGDSTPIVIENAPTLQNLLGTIDREYEPGHFGRSDHTMIQAGSLLRADSGYLLMEARDVLLEPGAWKVLVRTLRTGRLDIVPSEFSLPFYRSSLKPEPIPIDVKVILVGDPDLYALLDGHDPDFPHLFKLLADFNDVIPSDEAGVTLYARVLARIQREEALPAFEAPAVAALAEHGARIAARQDRLTTRFGRLADIAREAAFIARKAGRGSVQQEDVRSAVRRNRGRADLPARRFRERIADGTIRIQVQGEAVGQVNGLAVVHAGPLTYGFPARITATIGPGTAGAIDIEREAQLSGAIHTKGFYILGGLLRHLLRTDHPLAFSASIAFEQSYGGIDGDSASGAEMCCLISALTEIPLRQDTAMTGSIDQHGNIQPVGAVTEKVEGFFDVCQDIGLSGTQGVIIPGANVQNLMLREDVVEACAADRFQVYAAGTIQEALEILTGKKAGERDEDGLYPEGTILARAMLRAWEFWEMASSGSGRGRSGDEDADDLDGGPEEERELSPGFEDENR